MGRHTFTVTATVVGDPNINAEQWDYSLSELAGIADDTYEIDNITHDFGMSGYTIVDRGKDYGAKQ